MQHEITDEMTFEEKSALNAKLQRRYDELMAIGKHGHYETMFQVFHEMRRELAPRFRAQGMREAADMAKFIDGQSYAAILARAAELEK